MCIAIYKKEGIHLFEKTLETSWNSNPDGAGFMYCEKDELHLVKGLMTYEAFKEAYEPHKSKECIIHFRIATHGGVTPENTHPFLVDKTLGMVHNGILTKVNCSADNKKSDTWHFVDQFLKKFHKLDEDFWLDDSFKTIIEEYIGQSKFILMDNRGNVDIYNESLGYWDSNCWFSNQSYKWEKTNYSQPYKRSYSKQEKTNVIPFEHKTTNPNFVIQTSILIPEVNDYCVLIHDAPVENPSIFGEAFSKGTIIKIKDTSKFLIQVENPMTNKMAMVPLWKLGKYYNNGTCLVSSWYEFEIKRRFTEKEERLENTFLSYAKGDEIVFIKNYNHFRIGDIKIVKESRNFFIDVEDLNKNKIYSIPKDVITTSSTLMVQ